MNKANADREPRDTVGNSPADLRMATAAVFTAQNQPLELVSFRVPALKSGEALIRIECCTLCGSDIHTISGARVEPTPSILGHEAIGVVEALGDPAPAKCCGEALNVGDRVTWSVIVACGECGRCQSGLPQKCIHLSKYGHGLAEGDYALSGGLAEYIILRNGSAIVTLENNLPAAVCCPANCATSTVAAAFRMLQIPRTIAGSRVLILGAGMLGLTASAWASDQRADSVTICDRDSSRLELASQFGANQIVQWDSEVSRLREQLQDVCGHAEFDVILEMAGAPSAVEAAFELGGIGSRVALVGSVMKSPAIAVDPEQIVRRCQAIFGVHNYTPEDLVAAVRFLERCHQEYPFEQLCQHRFTLAASNEAVAFVLDQRPVRVAVAPHV